MKKSVYFIFTFLLLLFLAGCSRQQESETDMTPGEIATAIRQGQQGLPEMMEIISGDADFSAWLSDYYLMQTEQVADGVICYADGVEASEIAVLLLKDEKDCKAAEEALTEYIRNRLGVFEGYAPQQAAMVRKGIVATNGRYITLLICPEPSDAKAAFSGCFTGEDGSRESTEQTGGADSIGYTGGTKETKNSGNNAESPVSESGKDELPAGTEDIYSAAAVLEAYRSGDDTSLTEMNRSILAAARDVIASEIDNDMSSYEKELAIHDWITEHSGFSMSAFSRAPGSEGENGSDTPYGVLIQGSGNCWGYSSTFQLFMDMLDIECMTIFGIPGNSGVEHSWNMVKLEGEWYCVDCAWDDPIGGSPCHTYFNVTSDYLRSGSIHRWDENSVPEAAGTAYAYDR